jgi:(1->4)-alpha-D-glucan 1-alpha-D-glucosylmutase
MTDFLPFQQRIARLGMFNSLSQTLIKLTVPGVPDIYQGCECWDFSLVDPDNRRPVDFGHRQTMLHALQTLAAQEQQHRSAGVRELCGTLEDGRAKLLVVWSALALRNHWPEVFQQGEYLPLTVRVSMRLIYAPMRVLPESVPSLRWRRVFSRNCWVKPICCL